MAGLLAVRSASGPRLIPVLSDPTQHRAKVYAGHRGVLFGAMAGYNYWFPKAFGFKLDERWGKALFPIDGAGSTSGAAPCTSSSSDRYFASWPRGASV